MEKYPGWDPEAEVKSGSFNIIWDTDTPTSHTLLAQKEIRISRKDADIKPSVLAHEIAHSRLLKDEHISLYMGEEETEWEKIETWRELEAVMYTLAKSQSTEKWALIRVLEEASKAFGDGSLRFSKVIGKKILKHLRSRGFITKVEERQGINGLAQVNLSNYGRG